MTVLSRHSGFLGQVALGQHQKALFKDEMKDFSDADFKKIEGFFEGASDVLQSICHNMYWYEKALRSTDLEEAERSAHLIHQELERFGKNEGEAWIYLIAYCNVKPAILDGFRAQRQNLYPWKFPGFPKPIRTQFMRKGAYGPIATPPVTPREAASVPTVTVHPGPTSVVTPSFPSYVTVGPPSTPQYSPELQQQLESYESKLREFYGRPPTGAPVATGFTTGPQAMIPTATGGMPIPPRLPIPTMTPSGSQPVQPMAPWSAPTPTPMVPTPTPTPSSMRPFAAQPTGGGTPVPGTQRAPVPSTMCPPGQFWDGRQCRGSIGPMPGIVSAAAGGGVTAMGPGGLSVPGGAMSLMAGRSPYRPGRYAAFFKSRMSGSPSLGQTFDEILGLSPEVGDVLRLVYHGAGTWLGIHIVLTNNMQKNPMFTAIGWMVAGGMGIAGFLDLISLGKRVCGAHP